MARSIASWTCWRNPRQASAAEAGARIGPYAVIREIGQGGMGIVYLARRADGQYDRVVALKIARATLVDPALRGRFLSERDILAGLSHPNIAALYDGGVTPEGHPYFTMDTSRGRPSTGTATIGASTSRRACDCSSTSATR